VTTAMNCDVELRPRASQALFATIAHDLKNTLAGLILWCDTLELLKPRLAAGGDDQATALFRTILEQINTSVTRSVHVVDDLLDIGRLDAGHTLGLAAVELDLVALVEEVLQSRPLATTMDRMRLESVQTELWGCWDGDRLGRVLDNLVSNAIKYSPAGEPITVRVTTQNIEGLPHAVVDVEDRGIGIPADELPQIFDLFHRARNVGPSIPGHGIGLWISRAIVMRHGGTLTVTSREGRGTTVTVRLPLSPASAEARLDSGRRLAFGLGAGRL
jgi:signal transduction histidine kinase